MIRHPQAATLLKFRLLSLLFLVSLSGPACGKETDHTFRPITDEEKQTFYPMVCNGPADRWPDWDHACDKIPSVHARAPATDDPALITFLSIASGSFTGPGMDEAIIVFRSNQAGEQQGGSGSALFRREKGAWSLVDADVYRALNNCVVFTHVKRQEMLCLNTPLGCCMQSRGSVDLVRWGEEGKQLLSFHIGALGVGERNGFCEAGKAGKTLLANVNHLQRSDEPGVIGQADVAYVVADEINRVCHQNIFRDEPEFTRKRVRFILDGDDVKVLLPDGVSSYSVY